MEKKWIVVLIVIVIFSVISTALQFLPWILGNSFYADIAALTEGDCENYDSQAEKDSCYCLKGISKENVSYIEEKVSEEYREGCFSQMAIETQNRSLCERAGEINDFCLENT